MCQILKTLQRALYFPEDLASGATIGYHCTVVECLHASSQLNPTRPDLWLYRVFVPSLQKYVVVPSRDLFGLAETDPDFFERVSGEYCRTCEIRFDGPLEFDNAVVSGAFRLWGRQWESFHFRKRDLPYSSYELTRPVRQGNTKEGSLSYGVPQTEVLDRSYVLSALIEIIGNASWQSENAPEGA